MMGCFPKCFTSCKRRKHNKSVTVTSFKHQRLEKATKKVVQIQPAEVEPTKLEDFLNAIKPIKQSKEEIEEQSKNIGAEKKVTFDLNFKSHDEESSTKEVSNGFVEICDEKESDKKEETPKEMEPILDSIVSSQQLNHRYENCENSPDEDEEEDVLDLEGSDLNDENDDYEERVEDKFESKQISIQEVSSESSLFSLSIDSRKQPVCDAGIDEEVNSPMPKQPIRSNQNARDGGQNCQSVLNPIENLTQWKEVKQKSTAPAASKHQEKENLNLEQECYLPFCPELTVSLKLSKLCPRPKSSDQGTGVDTSLSSWLVESETTPKSNASNNSVGNNSPRSLEDGPILGAWTTEELKQLSASSTPKRSQSPKPDEMPIIGTVGSYWSRTDQTMDSDSSSSCRGTPKRAGKNRVDQKVKCKSSPFEAKLERALDMGILDV